MKLGKTDPNQKVQETGMILGGNKPLGKFGRLKRVVSRSPGRPYTTQHTTPLLGCSFCGQHRSNSGTCCKKKYNHTFDPGVYYIESNIHQAS